MKLIYSERFVWKYIRFGNYLKLVKMGKIFENKRNKFAENLIQSLK